MLVGAEGFEPPALCSQSRCATRLRYAPTGPNGALRVKALDWEMDRIRSDWTFTIVPRFQVFLVCL